MLAMKLNVTGLRLTLQENWQGHWVKGVQARSELRFWRGAELDKVKNPNQLYTLILGKTRKFVSF